MSQLKKGRGYVSIHEQSVTHSVTKVGKELLGQLKIVKILQKCQNNSISCAAIQNCARQFRIVRGNLRSQLCEVL